MEAHPEVRGHGHHREHFQQQRDHDPPDERCAGYVRPATVLGVVQTWRQQGNQQRQGQQRTVIHQQEQDLRGATAHLGAYVLEDWAGPRSDGKERQHRQGQQHEPAEAFQDARCAGCEAKTRSGYTANTPGRGHRHSRAQRQQSGQYTQRQPQRQELERVKATQVGQRCAGSDIGAPGAGLAAPQKEVQYRADQGARQRQVGERHGLLQRAPLVNLAPVRQSVQD